MSKLKRLEASQAEREENEVVEPVVETEQNEPAQEEEAAGQPVADPIAYETQAEGTVPEPQESSEVIALRKEIERLRARNQEAGIEEKKDRQLSELAPPAGEPTAEISKGETVLYNSWQQEVLDEFLDKNPQYGQSDKAWSSFQSEWNDRISLIEAAKRTGRPLTKRFIRERLESVHRALRDDSSVREEAKKEFAKSQTMAKIAGSGSAGSGERTPSPQPERRRILPRPNSGLQSWVKK